VAAIHGRPSRQPACLIQRTQGAAIQFMVDLIVKGQSVAPVTDLANPLFGSEHFYSGRSAWVTNGPGSSSMYARVRLSTGIIAPFPAGKAGSVTWVARFRLRHLRCTKHLDEAWKALEVDYRPGLIRKSREVGAVVSPTAIRGTTTFVGSTLNQHISIPSSRSFQLHCQTRF